MLQVLAASALALTAASIVTAQGSASEGLKGTDILNFALNLECLEAEFYSCAAFGVGLTPAERGYASGAEVPEGDATIGCVQANLTPFGAVGDGVTYGSKELAEEIAADEIAHVKFLRAALGPDAVPCPKMDISGAPDGAFNLAAKAATGTPSDTALDPTFDPYDNDLFFLHGAFIFEDVGVTAYNGAVPAATMLLPAETVQAAASILGVEAYHAGIVRARLQLAGSETDPAAYTLNVSSIVGAISNLRDSVDGDADLDQGILMDGEPNLVPTDGNGLAFARTIPQVLSIVYLGGELRGGFFPEGINGVFGNRTSTELDGLLATMVDTPDSDGMGSGAVGLVAGIVAGVAALAALL